MPNTILPTRETVARTIRFQRKLRKQEARQRYPLEETPHNAALHNRAMMFLRNVLCIRYAWRQMRLQPRDVVPYMRRPQNGHKKPTVNRLIMEYLAFHALK